MRVIAGVNFKAALLVGGLVLAGGAGVASAGGEPVTTLAGSWSGSGRIYYTDGKAENIHCTANYTGGGSELRMAIQCKSETNPIHIRSKLKIEGGRASGEWEERTFNASGSANGKAGDGMLNLSVSGGGFSGSMSVTFSKGEHSVVISTKGIAMSKASMSFKRS